MATDPAQIVGTPEHASCQADEIHRLNAVLQWVRDQLLNDDHSRVIAKTIDSVLEGEHHDVPGHKAPSWEALRGISN